MPFPLGHTAVALAVHETVSSKQNDSSRPGLLVYVTVLANLPDLDVVYGLIVQGNGDAFHRGPSHSLLFALVAGYLASQLWRLWDKIPRLCWPVAAGLIFSHIAADMLLTRTAVSLFWPFEVYWSSGYSGWGDVMHTVVFKSLQDAGIVIVSLAYIFLLRHFRGSLQAFKRVAFDRKH